MTLKIPVSLGILAHQQTDDIGRLLERIMAQRLTHTELREILIIARQDATQIIETVREFTRLDPRIHLLTRPTFAENAAAVNLFLTEALSPILILCASTLLPHYEAIERLTRPFTDPNIGLTTGRTLPLSAATETFASFASRFVWRCHHQLNHAGRFRAGPLVAFRKTFTRLPLHPAVEPASIESLIRGQGFKVHYISDALVYAPAAETVSAFLQERRRVYTGHLALRRALGYGVSTLRSGRLLPIFLKTLAWRPKRFFWGWAVAALELYSRWHGRRDYKHHPIDGEITPVYSDHLPHP